MCKTFLLIPYRYPLNVVEHRHEYVSTLKITWFRESRVFQFLPRFGLLCGRALFYGNGIALVCSVISYFSMNVVGSRTSESFVALSSVVVTLLILGV